MYNLLYFLIGEHPILTGSIVVLIWAAGLWWINPHEQDTWDCGDER